MMATWERRNLKRFGTSVENKTLMGLLHGNPTPALYLLPQYYPRLPLHQSHQATHEAIN